VIGDLPRAAFDGRAKDRQGRLAGHCSRWAEDCIKACVSGKFGDRFAGRQIVSDEVCLVDPESLLHIGIRQVQQEHHEIDPTDATLERRRIGTFR